MKQPTWAPAEIRICRPDSASEASIRSKYPTFFHQDGDDLVFRSWIDQELPISEHLKWLYGQIQHDRKFFRQLESAGVSTVVSIHSSERQFRLEPEALLLAPQFHLPIEIRLSK